MSANMRLILRNALPWGAVSALAIVTRTALDWFAPPETFYTRATVTTFTAITLFAAVGFIMMLPATIIAGAGGVLGRLTASWRSRARA